jgi:hypothetical protein
VKLRGASRATFRMDPAEGNEVAMTLIVDHESPELLQCTELVATTSKGEVTFGPFTAEKLGDPPGSMVALTTHAKVSAVKALAPEEGSVKLEGCGLSWDIAPDQTEDLRQLVRDARWYQRNHPVFAAPSDPLQPGEGNTEPAPKPTVDEAPTQPVP